MGNEYFCNASKGALWVMSTSAMLLKVHYG